MLKKLESEIINLIEKSLNCVKSYLFSIRFKFEEVEYFEGLFIKSSELLKVFLFSFYKPEFENNYQKILENVFLLNFYARLLDNILDEGNHTDKVLFIKANLIPLKIIKNFSLIFPMEDRFWNYFEKYIQITLDVHVKEQKKLLYEDYNNLGKKSSYFMIYLGALCLIHEKENLITFYENLLVNFFSARQIVNDSGNQITNKKLKKKYLSYINRANKYSDIINDPNLKKWLKSYK